MKNRGKRIAEERRIVKRRVQQARLHLLGISPKVEKQPHRLDKAKKKFTNQHDSMKKQKRQASRVARQRAKNALKRGEEPGSESKNSVKWKYW